MQAGADLKPDEFEAFFRHRLTFRQLRVVARISQAGSLSAAADALHITQPAVSKALSEIERSLGHTLFVWRGRNMKATPIGARMVELARQIEASLRRGAESMTSLARGATGELLIGASNAAMAEVLPEAMVAMKRDYPNVTLSIRSHAIDSLFNELRQGSIDLVVARVMADVAYGDLQATPMVPVPEVLTISLLSPLVKSRRWNWEVLNQQPWLWPLPGTRSRKLQDRLWGEMGLPLPSDLIETGDQSMVLALMKCAPLLSIMPKTVASAAAKQGVLAIVPLKVNLGLSDLMVWHHREPATLLVEHFKQLLLNASGAGDSRA